MRADMPCGHQADVIATAYGYRAICQPCKVRWTWVQPRGPITEPWVAEPWQPMTVAGQRRWDADPNHPESVDCDGYPLSSGERCGKAEHRPYRGRA